MSVLFEVAQQTTQQTNDNQPLITALISGGFVIVGALISFGSAWLVDWRRAKRESPRRWDDDIRTYAAEFLGHADSYIDGLRRIQRPLPKRDGPLPPPETVTVQHNYERMESIQEAPKIEAELFRVLSLLDFIAPPEVPAAGRKLHVELIAARVFANMNDPATTEKVERVRKDFVNEVRKAIDLPPVVEAGEKTARTKRPARTK